MHRVTDILFNMIITLLSIILNLLVGFQTLIQEIFGNLIKPNTSYL